MRRTSCVAALSALAAVSCAGTGGEDAAISEKAAERLAEFERTGEMRNCLGLRQISQIYALDDRHFLVRVGVNDYYLNEPRSRCSGAGNSFNRLQYTTSLAQLCRLEIITVVDNSNGFTVGSCSLGDFERLEKKAPESD